MNPMTGITVDRHPLLGNVALHMAPSSDRRSPQ
jgi:hypothetical protein